MIYLYTWDVRFGKWCFAGLEDDKETALEKGRGLWRMGASGVKIVGDDVLVERVRDGLTQR